MSGSGPLGGGVGESLPSTPPETAAWLDRSLVPALVALAVVLTLFEVSLLDIAVQDAFYDIGRARWLVDPATVWSRALFYTGPKALLIVFGLAVALLAVCPERWGWRRALGGRIPPDRRALAVVFATLATGPALIAYGKATTNVHCPTELRRYGGEHPYVRLFERSPASAAEGSVRGRCFPAGHASGGFALLSLAGLARTRRGILAGAATGLAVGWAMGLYQMAKGAHFLSHTLVTMLTVWIVFLLWRRVLRASG